MTHPTNFRAKLAPDAYTAFVQICKSNSDDAGTYIEDEELVRRALKRLDELESAALAALQQVAFSDGLPPDYIDSHIKGRDNEMLKTFYTACLAEGGTADEVHLRGLHAVLSRYGAQAVPVPVAPDPDVTRALVKAEAALADIGDSDRELGDDLAWCERRAAETLPVVREALAFCAAIP